MMEVKEHIHDESCVPKNESEAEAEFTQTGTSWATVSKLGYTPPAENAARNVSNAMLFAAPQAETGSYDFSGDITSVTVERQQGGQWAQSDTFTDGDTIRVTIRYTIPEGEIHTGQRNMHYQLPPVLHWRRKKQASCIWKAGTWPELILFPPMG